MSLSKDSRGLLINALNNANWALMDIEKTPIKRRSPSKRDILIKKWINEAIDNLVNALNI
ncbi:MAG: hypothetical protein WCS52_02180 [bacterium]